MPHLEVATPSLRPDVWASNAAPCPVLYRIQAQADADVLCRVLNLFALQQLIPQQVDVVRDQDTMSIEILSHEQSWHRAQIIGEKMRNLISVFEMELIPVQESKAPMLHVLR